MYQMVGESAMDGAPGTGSDRQLTMLLCSAGRRVELLRLFRRAAAAVGVDLRIIACDAHPEWSAACRLADKAIQVPRADDPGYIDVIEQICRDHGVGLIVPTIDPELQPLADARDRFTAIGAHVSASDPLLIAICRDKLMTAQYLAANGVPVPHTVALEDLDRAAWSGPAIVKPRGGSAGRAITRMDSIDELPDEAADEPMIVQELLRGEEWTVNVYFDGAGGLRAVVPHRRMQVRAGEVEKGITGRPPELLAIAETMATCLPGARGVLCFQAIIPPGGSAKVFEINARFGGGYPLADAAGASFAQWLIEERVGMPSTASDTWAEGMVMLRYDAAVFVSP